MNVGPRHYTIGAAVLLGALLLAFEPVRHNGFVNYDDNEYVTRNPIVQQGLTPAGLRWAFTTGHAANWHPLTWLSHMLDCQLFGLNPLGHHATSLALHAAATLLLAALLLRLTGRFWPALLVALLFGVHPQRVESVAWAAERKDVLSGVLFMLTLHAWVSYARRPGFLRYALVFALTALGLMAKPMLVTLPAVLLLLDLWPLARTAAPAGERLRRWRGLLLEKLPLLALAVAASMITLRVQAAGGAAAVDLPPAARWINAASAVWAYLAQFLWPAGLAVLYPHRVGAIPAWETLLATGGVAGLLAAAVLCVRRAPPVSVGLLWYLGMLVPVIGIVSVGVQAWADRYTYLPIIGVLLAIVFPLARRLSGRAAQVGVVVALVFAAALIPLTRAQTARWRDEVTLFRHSLAVTGPNPMLHLMLGRALRDRGDLPAAQAAFEQTLRLKPGEAGAHLSLGDLLCRQGLHNAAIPHFEAALGSAREGLYARLNLGNTLAQLGRHDAAIAQFDAALDRRPDFHQALYGRAVSRVRLGDLEAAMRDLAAAIAAEPRYAEAHFTLGLLNAQRGATDAATRCFRTACRLNPDLCARVPAPFGPLQP